MDSRLSTGMETKGVVKGRRRVGFVLSVLLGRRRFFINPKVLHSPTVGRESKLLIQLDLIVRTALLI